MENHAIVLENKSRMTVSRVVDVDAFDEETLWANLQEGAVEISGEGLHIEKLDLTEGMLVISGNICSFAYTDSKKGKGGKKLRHLAGRLKHE